MRGGQARGILCTLTIEDAWKLFEQQAGKCALSGCPIELPVNARLRGTASLDRIDSLKGYELGNVQWVHKHVNIMKHTLTQDEFIAICRAVTARHTTSPSGEPHERPVK